MAKDAYWFRHDSNAGRDLKLIRITQLHTHWGKGVYWDVIEILREQNTYAFPCDESSLQMLSGMIGCNDFPKFKSWFNDCLKCNLFEQEKGVFFSASLVERMSKWETKKDNGGLGGRGKKARKAKRKLNESETKANQKLIEGNKRREEKNKNIEESRLLFKQSIFPFSKDKGGLYDNEMLKAFFDYWSELNLSKTKMKFEMQKTWEVGRRLAKWAGNDFGKGKKNTPLPFKDANGNYYNQGNL